MDCKIKQLTCTGAALVLVTISSTVNAAGFQVYEHSATGLGRAYAGDAAIADSALVVTKNPAAMTLFERTSVSSQLAFIAPEVNIDYEYENRGELQQGSELDYAPDQFVPSFGIIVPVNRKVAVGFASFSNYGTGTALSDEFQLADLGGETNIITIDNSFNIAYKFADWLSIGAGYDLVIGQAEMSNTFNLAGKQAFDMSGNAIGHGWNIGALLSFNENNRMALAYRSGIDMGFEGDFVGEGELRPNKESGGPVTGTVDVTLPAIAEFSGYHKLSDTFAVHYSATWTQWSVLTELSATSSDCHKVSFADPFEEGVCFYKDLEYNDSMRYAIGTTAYVSELFTLRFGYAYDHQAGDPIVVMPDTNRHQFSAGMSIAATDALSFDMGASYVIGDEVTFTEESMLGKNTSFTSNGTGWIGAVQMNYVF